MSKGKPYFAGLTKAQLTKAIREELEKYPLAQEFEFVLASDLIAEKHYYCAPKGIRPVRFRKSFRPGSAYDFYGYFPEHGWHLVSWVQCISPRDEYDWLKRALRDSVQPIIAQYKSLHPICEICSSPSEHVDHVDPEFDSIASEAINTLRQEQIEQAFAEFNWWSKEPFSLPSSHPAVEFARAAHKTAILRAVCQPCHVRSARQRRSA